MKIAIVHPYPTAEGEEDAGAKIIVRDRALGSLFQLAGHDVRGFKTTRSPVQRVVSVDEYMDWSFLCVDSDTMNRSAQHVESSRLIDAVTEWSPDVCLVKGASTAVGAVLGSYPQWVFGTIIGGGYTNPMILKSDLVLTENEEQDRYFGRRIGRGRVVRLPKLAGTDFVGRESQKNFDIAVVSKFEPHKNHQALIPLLDEQDLSMVFIGGGKLREEFERVASAKPARTYFPGFVDPEEVADLLRRSCLLVHPSLSEGFPRAVVEAMAVGVPAVCIKGVVGSPVRHGFNGMLVEEHELVHQVRDLLGNPELVFHLGRAAEQTYAEEFSIEALSRAAEVILEKLDSLREGLFRRIVRRRVMASYGRGLNAPTYLARMATRALRALR